MARSYGRFTTNIWLDPDFTSLSLEQQGAYFTLGLQPDVTAAGVLPYTSRRWSKLSDGMSRDHFEKLVGILAESAGRHLVVDEDTEEVLIRKFMKWDMGWANTQKRLRVVLDAVDSIASYRIRDSAIAELWKIPAAELGTPESRDALSAQLRIRFPENGNTVSGSDRVVVTLEGKEPQPAFLIPQPVTGRGEPLAADAGDPPSNLEFCDEHQPDGTDEPCGRCAGRRKRAESRQSDRAERQAAEKKRLAGLRAACTDCNPAGWLEDEHGHPLRRCGHPNLAAPAAPIESRTA